jgi:hypothetical protein
MGNLYRKKLNISDLCVKRLGPWTYSLKYKQYRMEWKWHKIIIEKTFTVTHVPLLWGKEWVTHSTVLESPV